MGQSYEALLQRALRKGDQASVRSSFEKIYEAYSKLVFFSLSRCLKDDDAKDLTNETFLQFFTNADKVNCSIKYYLLTSAKNLAFNKLAKDKRIGFYDSLEERGAPNDLDSGFLELVNDLQAVLSRKEVSVVLLRALDGLSFKEIGSRLEMSEDASRMCYERAKKKFKDSKRGKQYEKQ